MIGLQDGFGKLIVLEQPDQLGIHVDGIDLAIGQRVVDIGQRHRGRGGADGVVEIEVRLERRDPQFQAGQILDRGDRLAADDLAQARHAIAGPDHAGGRRQLRQHRLGGVAAQDAAGMGDVIGQEGRIKRAEIRRAVRHFGHRHEGHVERAGLQLLQHLGLVAELARREHRHAVGTAAGLGQVGAKGFGGLGPDMRRRRDEAQAEFLRERGEGRCDDDCGAGKGLADGLHCLVPCFCFW